MKQLSKADTKNLEETSTPAEAVKVVDHLHKLIC